MTPTRAALLCLLALGLFAVAAPVPKEAKKTDAQLIEGKWESVTLDEGKGPSPDTGCTVTFKDGRVTMDYGGDVKSEAQFTLDESTTPKQMDITSTTDKKPVEYIYKIDGDTLTLCHGPRKSPRVTEFKGGPDRVYCFVLKRVKE